MKALREAVAILLLLSVRRSQCDDGDDDDNDLSTLEVLMPGVTTTMPETYLCTGVAVPDDLDFVIGYTPLASMKTVHHMLVYGCGALGVAASGGGGDQPAWLCGHGAVNSGRYSQGPVCGGGSQQIIYAWARDAPPLELPPDTGFEIGRSTKSKYIVAQIHFKDTVSIPDSSGVRLELTKKAQARQAGVTIMGSMGMIPPMGITYLDSACQVTQDVVFRPFGFRTHSHNLGRVISGYRIDPVTLEWSLIGKMDPRKPQMFYPVEDNDLTIRKGDWLAARCTMESDRTKTTYMGSTNNDEMCNFYIMYAVDPTSPISTPTDIGCFGGNDNKWSNTFDNVPDDASEYDGVNYVEGPLTK